MAGIILQARPLQPEEKEQVVATLKSTVEFLTKLYTNTRNKTW